MVDTEDRSKFVTNVLCLYDKQEQVNNQYIQKENFTGFDGKRLRFVITSIIKGISTDVIILSHVNLLIIAFFVKLFSPKTKLVLFAHGIEIWSSLPKWKLDILKKFDLVLCVSSYTRNKVIEVHKLTNQQCVVLNNCLDPFLAPVTSPNKRLDLLTAYNLEQKDIVLLTLTRLTFRDRNKGCDKVIRAIKSLSKDFPALKYMIVGKYDESERIWIESLIEENLLKGSIILTGYINDNELGDYMNLADIYIMPSIKEGFGVTLIEAMYYEKPVIAVNRDGSVDALKNGELGILVDPLDESEITNSIKKVICNIDQYKPDRHKVMTYYSFPAYKKNLREHLDSLFN